MYLKKIKTQFKLRETGTSVVCPTVGIWVLLVLQFLGFLYFRISTLDIFYSKKFCLPQGCEGIFDVSFYNLYGSEFFVWVAWLNFCIQTKVEVEVLSFFPPLFIQYPASYLKKKKYFLIELNRCFGQKSGWPYIYIFEFISGLYSVPLICLPLHKHYTVFWLPWLYSLKVR